jgi:hypothetical protein
LNRHNLLNILVLAAAMVFIVTSASTSPDGSPSATSVSWRGDYETGDFSQWYGQLQGDQSSGVQTAIVREGRYAGRFVVRPGQVLAGATGERSDLWHQTGEVAGHESWWAWSTYFGDDFNPSSDPQFNAFTSWHNSGCCGQSNAHFELDTSGTPWKIRLRTFGGQQDQNERRFNLADFRRNHWFDFVFHVRWATDNTGFVEVWVDGKHVLPKTNTPTIYVNQGVYLKQGFYRRETNNTTVIYHDGMRRGQSYAEVAPTSASTSSPAASAAPVPAPPASVPAAPTRSQSKAPTRSQRKRAVAKRPTAKLSSATRARVTPPVWRRVDTHRTSASGRVANAQGKQAPASTWKRSEAATLPRPILPTVDFIHEPRPSGRDIVVVGRGPQQQWLRILIRTQSGKTVAESWTWPRLRGRVERRLALPSWLRRRALRVILQSRIGHSYSFARRTVYLPRQARLR